MCKREYKRKSISPKINITDTIWIELPLFEDICFIKILCFPGVSNISPSCKLLDKSPVFDDINNLINIEGVAPYMII